MNWLNLNVQILDSEVFLGSEPTDRATWLCLLRFCIGQENSGTICDCGHWPDRKWQQLVRITKKEVTRSTKLWSWDGNNLTVWEYPSEKEQEVKEKRDRARTNGQKGGRPKQTNEGTKKEPTLVISAKAEGERKGKEGEGESEVSHVSAEKQPASIYPEPLRDIAFGARWEEWEIHCRDKGRPLTAVSRNAQLAECATQGRDNAMKALIFSITNNRDYIGWEWMRDADNRKNGTKPKPKASV